MALCFLNAHLHCVSWHVPEMVDANLTITVSYQNAFCLHGKQQRGELDPWLSWAHYGWIQAEKGYKKKTDLNSEFREDRDTGTQYKQKTYII